MPSGSRPHATRKNPPRRQREHRRLGTPRRCPARRADTATGQFSSRGGEAPEAIENEPAVEWRARREQRAVGVDVVLPCLLVHLGRADSPELSTGEAGGHGPRHGRRGLVGPRTRTSPADLRGNPFRRPFPALLPTLQREPSARSPTRQSQHTSAFFSGLCTSRRGFGAAQSTDRRKALVQRQSGAPTSTRLSRWKWLHAMPGPSKRVGSQLTRRRGSARRKAGILVLTFVRRGC